MTDRELAELARETPVRAPDAARRQAMRDAILLEIEDVEQQPAQPRGRGRVAAVSAVVALAAAAALVFVLLRGDDRAGVSAATQRAKVQVSSAADFVHSAHRVDGVNDEIVRVHGGRVSVAVDKLRKDERFRVVTGDGEVEVRGTAFDVVVAEDRLEAVVVHHGLVVVRVGGKEIEVAGGERWSREEIAVVAPEPVPVPVPVDPVPDPAPVAKTSTSTSTSTSTKTVTVTEPEPEPEPVTATATATEIAFRDGRAALKAGSYAAAAEMFERAIAADDDAPLAEDARYFRGVALAKAGKDAAATRALAEFLEMHPTSLRAGRAALMLGNLLAAAGDREGAKARYASAAQDADRDVRAAARKALDAL